jgi:hypothetical protein
MPRLLRSLPSLLLPQLPERYLCAFDAGRAYRQPLG